MEKRLFKRPSGKLIAAAVASVGFVGLATPKQADAAVLIDIRLTSINGSAGAVSNSKLNAVNIGDTVTFNVVMRISGTDGVQTTGNFDNSLPATDTRNNDAVQSLVGAFDTVGTLKGNFLPDDQTAGNTSSAFSASGANNGQNVDINGDGALDLGALGTDPTNMWAARSGFAGIPTVGKSNSFGTRFGITNVGSTGSSAQFTVGQDTGGAVSTVTGTNVIDANTGDALLGELSMVITSGSGLMSVQFVPRANADAGGLWFLDGSTVARNGANDSETVSPAVLFVPEPGSLGLLGLASLGLLARRRKQS